MLGTAGGTPDSVGEEALTFSLKEFFHLLHLCGLNIYHLLGQLD